MIISFTHNGTQYLNFDTTDEQAVAFLVEQIGQQTYDDAVNNYINPPSDRDRIEALEDAITALMGV